MENNTITHGENTEFFNICLRAHQHKKFNVIAPLIFNQREKYILSKFYYNLVTNNASFENECFDKKYTLKNIEEPYKFSYHPETYEATDTIKWSDFGDKNYWLINQ